MLRYAVVNGAVVPPRALRLLDGAPADPFSNALHRIGLTLESKKAPLDFVVIDSALKAPTEN